MHKWDRFMAKFPLTTKHLNIWLFDEFGIGIGFRPHWSVYILIGFVGINIFLNEGSKRNDCEVDDG